MPIEVDPDWWKTLFDDVYLLTDARSVGDESLTRLEVDVVCELLPMEADHKILDLCGGHGRHSFELCKRGFEACTLIDYSHALIDVAKEKVRKNNYSLKVVRCDARQIDLGPDQFNHVLIMGNSHGKFAGVYPTIRCRQKNIIRGLQGVTAGRLASGGCHRRNCG
jgi:D-alanine-D-alanine ligase